MKNIFQILQEHNKGNELLVKIDDKIYKELHDLPITVVHDLIDELVFTRYAYDFITLINKLIFYILRTQGQIRYVTGAYFFSMLFQKLVRQIEYENGINNFIKSYIPSVETVYIYCHIVSNEEFYPFIPTLNKLLLSSYHGLLNASFCNDWNYDDDCETSLLNIIEYVQTLLTKDSQLHLVTLDSLMDEIKKNKINNSQLFVRTISFILERAEGLNEETPMRSHIQYLVEQCKQPQDFLICSYYLFFLSESILNDVTIELTTSEKYIHQFISSCSSCTFHPIKSSNDPYFS
ncbi:hypothetical protein [Fluoribacter gormanii]|uniref:hypothetical protein n=1 Tax=Fluoribacter gormanii TaxID=464 RepID=UPI00104140AC|nr:hypothetical protein [Fluoribacter gormanii]